ncbi:predicted protein [Nematostella vectensis]|uniref:Uncharacterized protein n=1 Tax=Nematostella vectensis TaxID=45351 RepID=A7T065_NEMVE|nr:predicted protein [Nematostella vectensis]|eukprot:XP_001622760.1 predicted protein [Nematostella vectensis]
MSRRVERTTRTTYSSSNGKPGEYKTVETSWSSDSPGFTRETRHAYGSRDDGGDLRRQMEERQRNMERRFRDETTAHGGSYGYKDDESKKAPPPRPPPPRSQGASAMSEEEKKQKDYEKYIQDFLDDEDINPEFAGKQ